MTKSDILVSILCTAYNHEKFIEKTIIGFLNQVTEFNYEIIIHDDASSDKTPHIINEYKNKYPNIIKPILQNENQYSKGVNILHAIMLPIASGKYIAFCEGDDYWIDELKLQKQITYMEKNQGCTFSFTNALIDYNSVPKHPRKLVAIPWTPFDTHNYNPHQEIFRIEDIIKMICIPTASFVVRKHTLHSLPKLSNDCFQGDRYIELYSIYKGYGYFVNEITCAYRRNVEGSLTNRWQSIVSEKKTIHPVIKQFLAMYDEFDVITNNKFSKELDILRIQTYLDEAIRLHDKRFLRRSDVKDIVRRSGIKIRIKYLLAYTPVFPLFMYCYQLIKKCYYNDGKK